MSKIRNFLANPWRIFYHINFFHWMDWLPDKQYLQLVWRMDYGKKLDLKHPKTFTEKMQWLKLYDRKPEYTIMADKVKAKDWVAERIGWEHIIPTLGVWVSAEEVDFDALPNRFVIKCNHNSSGLYICKDKSKMNVESVRQKLNKGLHEDYYLKGREWPYKDIPRRIIAEEYIEDNGHDGDLPDYKFFCFNGEPKYCQVIRGRHSLETIDFYDMDWKHQEFVGLNPVVGNGLNPVERPAKLEEMKTICSKLAKGMPFVRVDLYIVGEKTYFGEITFFPLGGMGTFTPDKYNDILGKMIKLPGTFGGGIK